MGDELPSRKTGGVCGVSAKAPLVSVMMPVFNGAKTAVWALASVIAQTIEDWEAVVVDDGSADGTYDAIRSIGHPKIRVFRFDENRGRGAARQFALENCQGKFLAMVDADDWWYPWKLEQQITFLKENADIGVVSSAMASVGGNGTIRGVWKLATAMEGAKKVPRLCSLSNLSVPHAPCLVRMELATSVGYDTHLRRSEDFVFLARVLRHAPHAVLPDVLYAYTDAVSFHQEGAFGRYLWSARASLRLVTEYGGGAVLRSGRSILQAILPLLRANSSPVPRSTLREPKAGEAGQFERARREVESVMQGLNL
jgi:glycosyltransferase involved in cell wall biosynthesis